VVVGVVVGAAVDGDDVGEDVEVDGVVEVVAGDAGALVPAAVAVVAPGMG
jgi:hypothetical protein